MPPLDPRCPHCQGPLTQDGPPTLCPWCGVELAPPPLPEAEALPLPDDAFDDVPLVLPAAKPTPIEELPEARPFAAKPPPSVRDAPRTRHIQLRRPEPKMGLALLVLFAMIVAIGCALSVILVALWMGFQTVAKPRRGELPPADSRTIIPNSRLGTLPITFGTPAHAPPTVEVC